MGQRVLAENAGVMTVRYVLPNKHYIPVDMKYMGVDNTTPYVLPHGLVLYGIRFFWGKRRTEGTNPFLEMSSASCCGAEVDGECDPVFLDRSLFLSSFHRLPLEGLVN